MQTLARRPTPCLLQLRPSRRTTTAVRSVMTPPKPAVKRPYNLVPYKGWAMEARGLDLKQPVPPEVVEQIKEDVATYRLVIFKDQGRVPAEKHAEIGAWFGEVDSSHYVHEKAEHPLIFRLSNDDTEGWYNPGADEWHIDGGFRPAPHTHTHYHIASASSQGTTDFIPFKELLARLDPEQRDRWERLWVVNSVPTVFFKEDPMTHPLIYKHPITGEPCMVINIKEVSMHPFIYDKGTPQERETDKAESQAIREEILAAIEGNDDLIIRHLWQEGDLALSDNLALGHIATPESLLPRDEIGLRILHRCSNVGKFRPSKGDLIPV